MNWEPSDNDRYNADAVQVGDYLLEVCIDDEGPMWEAYYWDISIDGARITDGWAGSVARAKRDAIRELCSIQKADKELSRNHLTTSEGTGKVTL